MRQSLNKGELTRLEMQRKQKKPKKKKCCDKPKRKRCKRCPLNTL